MNWTKAFRQVLAVAAGCLLTHAPAAFAQQFNPAGAAPRDRVEYNVLPSQADPRINRFNAPNMVVFNRSSGDHPQLMIFMPGTGGNPQYTQLLQSVVANQGYRVIGLEYNDTPPGLGVCNNSTDDQCYGKFREKRTFGTDVTNLIDDKPYESIVARLVSLLRYLDRQHPQDHWGRYLVNNEPDWSQIVVSGLSQGAGMAAYIAHHKVVPRVVLFSSPWDTMNLTGKPAAWLYDPSATPLNRWFAEYHHLEVTSKLIIGAYAALQIPQDHIRVFNLGLPRGASGDNPYHPSTVHLAGYIPAWQAMFGRSPQGGTTPPTNTPQPSNYPPTTNPPPTSPPPSDGEITIQSERAAHPNLVQAIAAAEAALTGMQRAPDDFGGNKAAAMADARRAIHSIKRALYYRLRMDDAALDRAQ